MKRDLTLSFTNPFNFFRSPSQFRKYIVLIFSTLLLLLVFSGSIAADEIDDLTEEDREVYGSEKRKRFKSTNLFYEVEDWENHYSRRIFFLYREVNYPKFTSTRFFPIYNSVESKIDRRKSSRILNYQKTNGASSVDYSFFPLYFWGSDTVSMSNYSLIPLVFSREVVNRPDYQFSYFLSPVYYYNREYRKDMKDITSASPLHIRTTKISENYYSDSLFFPILPLVFLGRENEETHRNYFWIFDIKRNKERLSRLFLFPLFYYKSPEVERTKFISPLYYYQDNPYRTESLTSLLLYKKSYKERKDNRLYVFPFYYQFETEDSSSRHLIPIYSQKKTLTDSHFYLFPYLNTREKTETSDLSTHKILPVFKISREAKDGLQSLQVLPIFGYKKRDYFWLFPLIYKTLNEEKEAGGSTLAPFYYSKVTSDSKETYLLTYYSYTGSEGKKLNVFPFYFSHEDHYRYILPFYFHRDSGEKKEYSSSIGPMYYFSETPFQKTSYILNYYNREKKDGKEYFTTFFPFYLSWRSRESIGKFNLWSLELEDREGETFSVNLLGLATSKSRGLVDPSFDMGRKDEVYYLDTDISWVHSLFRISSRVSSRTKFLGDFSSYFEEKKEEELSEDKPSSPTQSRRKTFTREDSYTFWGWNALFGALAYEKADTKKHIRLFPLTWFTWDEKSDDRVILVPPLFPLVFLYTSDDQKYKIFFPFYAMQKNPEEERHAFFLAAYIKESLKEKNFEETSVLWPFFNRYSYHSDSGEIRGKGFRLAPLFWSKQDEWEDVGITRNFSPLHYFSREKDGGRFGEEGSSELQSEEIRFLSPLSRYVYSENKYSTHSNLILPLYYRDRSTYPSDSATYSDEVSFSPLFYSEKIEVKNPKGGTEILDSDFFSPLYLGFHNKKNDIETGSIFLPLPFLYHSYKNRDTVWNLLLFFTRKSEDNEALRSIQYSVKPFFIPFFEYENRNSIQNKNSNFTFYLFPYYYEKRNTAGHPSEYTNTLFPIYYISTNEYRISDKNYYQKYSRFWSPLYYRMSITNSKEEIESKQFITPAFFYSARNSESSVWRWFYFIRSYKSELSDEVSVWPILPLFYKTTKRDANKNVVQSELFSLLYFNSSENYEFQNEKHEVNWFFPFYAYSKDSYLGKDENESFESETNHFYSLPYIRTYSSTKDSFQLNRRYLLFFTHDTEKFKDQTLEVSYSFQPILPIVYYEQTKHHTYLNAFWFMDFKKNRATDSWERFAVFPFWYDDDVHFHIFPIFFSRTSPNLKSGFVSGLYYYFAPEYSRMNFLFLADYKSFDSHSEGQTNHLNFLFSSLSFKSYTNHKSFSLLYGISELEVLKESSRFNFLWLGYSSQPKDFDLNLLPIYQYEKDPNETTHTLIPLLGYSKRTDQEVLDFAGLGMMYYYHRDNYKNEELRHILLGTLLYQTKKSKNGYSSIGSLWGWLWNYESETETGYNKFSILKLISREEYNGEVRYLGIKF